MTCTRVREDAATVLLTGSVYDAPTVDHLKECDACRRDLDSLAALPALLAIAVDPAIPPSCDDALPIDRLLEAAARIQRRRRRRSVLAVAAATLVLLALPTALLVNRGAEVPPASANTQGIDTTTPVMTVQRAASNANTGVEGKVTLRAAAWGSDLTFALRGVPSGTECTLVVVSADGSREAAARWHADYEGTAHVTGAVSAPLTEIDHVEVTTQEGDVVLRVPVS